MIEAKPTRYRGTQFKSRLEARWAVFFDTLGLRWKYEPTEFRINGTAYTPDFRVKRSPGQDLLLEVKPDLPTEDVLETLRAIHEQTEYHVLLGHGSFFKGVAPLITDMGREAAYGVRSYFTRFGFSFSEKAVEKAISTACKYRLDLRS